MELKDKCFKVREIMGLSQKEFGTTFLNTNQTEISFIERGFIPEDNIKIKIIDNMYKKMEKGGMI